MTSSSRTDAAKTAGAAAWSGRTLDVCRAAALFTGVSAPISTAAASLGSAVFLIALLVSGRAHRVALAAYRLPAGKAVLAFLAWVLVSAAYNDAGWRAALPDFWAWRKVGFLFLALPLFSDERWKRRAVLAVCYTFSAAMLLSYASFPGWIPHRFDVPGVMLTNYAIQGAAFAFAALCSAQLALGATGRARWIYGALAAALVINVVFFNYGRTGYLALVGLTLAWAVLAGGWRWTIGAGAALALLLASAYLVSPTFHTRVAMGIEHVLQANSLKTKTSMGIRLIFIENAFKLIRERPLLGYGLGSYKRVYAQYVASHDTGVKATPSADPHNQYVYVLFEYGAVGLALFLLMIGVLFKSFPRDPYGRLAACALTAWCLTSLFSSHFRTFPEGHFYAFLIAMLGAPLKTVTRDP